MLILKMHLCLEELRARALLKSQGLTGHWVILDPQNHFQLIRAFSSKEQGFPYVFQLMKQNRRHYRFCQLGSEIRKVKDQEDTRELH